jgi:5-methylcytosine-specific restriction protein B
LALDKRILRDLQNLCTRFENEGELLANDELDTYYAAFRDRFRPEKLETLEGDELLESIHDQANHNSLIYWLEFKKGNEFDTSRLGSIRGGSALKFGVYRNAKTGAWMGKGVQGGPVEISVEQAIETASKHRDQFIQGCELLENFPQGRSDADYESLQEKMDALAPDVSRLAWGHKYFSLLYPDKLDDYHNPHYQRFHLVKLLQLPPGGDGRYMAAGRYVSAAAELGVRMANLTRTLNLRDGEPHSYWRVLVNYPNFGKDWLNWPEMRDGDFLAIGWEKLGDLSGITQNMSGKQELRERMKNHYRDPGRWTNEIFNFVAGMQEGDIVLAFEASKVLGVGKIIGPYTFDHSSRIPHRHAVRWLSKENWELPHQEGQGSAIREIRNLENQVEAERHIFSGRSGPTTNGPSGPVAGFDQLSDKTNLTQPELKEIEALLKEKKQLVFEGPPGAGKTYVAELFARYWTGNQLDGPPDQRIMIVQFHQSYGYEDFIQGIRPETNAKGQLEYHVRDGAFKYLCNVAKRNEDKMFVMLIDEINRGNVSRIFGELLFLLEYRTERVTLPYSYPADPKFSIPSNIYLLGTMNTTDRSLAQIDYALRRRFYFYRMMPVVNGTAPVLGRWLQKQQLSQDDRERVLRLFINLNRRVQVHLGENFQVGHSYFMVPDIASEATLHRVWAHAVIPLLEEYFYNRRDKDKVLSEFEITTLLSDRQ